MAVTIDKTTHGAARRGMTLIEAVISVLIVGVMLVAALTTLAGSAKARVVQQVPPTYQALARQLLSEVMQAAYEDPENPGGFGVEADEDTTTRADFDDVDDYHGWTAVPPQAKDGKPLDGYPECARLVQVSMVYPSGLGVPVTGEGVPLKEIHVYVSDEGGDWYIAQGLRSKYDAHSGQFTEERTVVTWVGIDLEMGAAGDQAVHTGVNLVNQPQEPQGG